MRRILAVMVLGLGLSITLADVALARIKLITLPVRERVEIQLDNPNATLVEEERIVPLVKGVNQVDFSWANTQIDPNTIVFRVVPKAAEAEAEKQSADAAKSLADKQKQLDAAEKQLAMLNGSPGARTVQRETPASRPDDSHRPRPLKSGNCTLDAKNIVALKGCIEDFNR